MTATQTPIKLLPQYKRLDIPREKRYVMVRGGRGSAKSFHLSAWLNIKTYEKHNILFTRYTMESAQDSIIPSFIRVAEELQNDGAFVNVRNNVTNRFSGSTIKFRGIRPSSKKQTAKLKSLDEVTIWVCDEADEIPTFEDFQKIDLSIRKEGVHNIIVLVFNTPDPDHWIYEEFFEEEREDTEYIYTTYLDNLENLDESFLKTAEREKKKSPKRYKKVYLGEWLKGEDACFPNGFTLYDEEPTDIDWQVYGGDFGYTDPTCLLRITKAGRSLYIRQLIYKSKMRISDIGNEMQANDWVETWSSWDSAEPRSIVELRMMNIPAKGAKKGYVYTGIMRLNEFDLYIHRDSLKAQKEFKKAVWEKEGENFTRNTLGHRIMATVLDEDGNKLDHAIAAARYGVSTYIDMGGLD
jgi:phage terminase large subunit